MLTARNLVRNLLRNPGVARVVRAAVPIALVLSLASCQDDSIPFPTSDATPPTIEWTLLSTADNSTQKTTAGNSALDVDRATDLRVTCRAWDNEGGIKSIKSGGYLDRACNLDGRSQHEVLTPLSSDHTALPSGRVNAGSFTSGNYHLQFDGCAKYSGEMQLSCTAMNYLGKSSTSHLSVTFNGG